MTRFLVAIHDVTPALFAESQALWAICAQRGVVPALFVVPQWHGAHAIERDHEFLQWLGARVNDGAEIFLHGERHDEAGLPRSPRDSWRAWGRTAREAEFLTLDEASALARIERGLTRLRVLGFAPIGFVAPAWLSRADASRAPLLAGLGISEDERWVLLHRQGIRVSAPVIRWSSRSRVRAIASSAIAPARWHIHRRAPTMRIALHPSDLHRTITSRSVLRTLDRAVSDRRAIRYADL